VQRIAAVKPAADGSVVPAQVALHPS
jgi:hypothetical protein